MSPQPSGLDYLKWAIEITARWTKDPLCLDVDDGMTFTWSEGVMEGVLAHVGGVVEHLKAEGHQAVATELRQVADAALEQAGVIDDADRALRRRGRQGAVPETLIQEARQAGKALCLELAHISDGLAAGRKPIPLLGTGGYDPDAYMPVKELREKMDPPWDFGTWTKIKTANPWIRFDLKAPANRPRIHRADAGRLEKGKLNPDTFELLDEPGLDLPAVSKNQIAAEYLKGVFARKAEIDKKKQHERSD